MGGNFIDLTGKIFGRLTALYENGKDKYGNRLWHCRCNCNNQTEIDVRYSSLINDKTHSCGCIKKEFMRKQGKAKKKYNPCEICGDYVTMYTLKGEPFYVDIEDYDKVKDLCWRKDDNGYLIARLGTGSIRIHTIIMNTPDGTEIDHIHGETTRNDNRKSNLRIGTHQKNIFNCQISKNNTSGVTGVYYRNDLKKWAAQIHCGVYEDTGKPKCYYLGTFDNKEDAIAARKAAEEKYFGEWSYDNSQNL